MPLTVCLFVRLASVQTNKTENDKKLSLTKCLFAYGLDLFFCTANLTSVYCLK